jgi:hypothetical protein
MRYAIGTSSIRRRSRQVLLRREKVGSEKVVVGSVPGGAGVVAIVVSCGWFEAGWVELEVCKVVDLVDRGGGSGLSARARGVTTKSGDSVLIRLCGVQRRYFVKCWGVGNGEFVV